MKLDSETYLGLVIIPPIILGVMYFIVALVMVFLGIDTDEALGAVALLMSGLLYPYLVLKTYFFFKKMNK